MKYYIEAAYQTGNSFGSEDTTDRVSECDDIETAKKNLARIKEHYTWYEDENDSYKRRRREMGLEKSKPLEKPIWLNTEYDFQLRLLCDNGEGYLICAPWCGYFERLYGAKIVIDDSELQFSI